MAENFIRIQRWENGQLVEDYTVAKPAEQFNAETLRERAVAALATNATIVSGADDYLALASPSQAQVVAQVRALTQAARAAALQRNGIIRLTLQAFDSIDDA